MTKKSVGICYFSGTGNTETVAHLLAKEFEKSARVDVVKIEDVLKGVVRLTPEEYDIIGVGYPVHALNAPKIVFKFISQLPHGDKKMFLFKTSGDPFMRGGPTAMVRSRLCQKGYTVFYEGLVVMPSNVLIKYDDTLVKQLYNTAVKKAAKMAEDILSGTVKIQKDNIFSQVLAYLFSGLEWMGTPFIGKDLRVLPSCILCDECVRNCPTNTIARENNTITFGWGCIACMRCIYTCPVNAIKPRLYKFFALKEYNIQKIIDDPTIKGDYVSKDTRGYFKRFYDYIME